MATSKPWTCTYRVQLHAGFGFDDLAAVVPYLNRLGISHVYLSPILQAAPGSTHGYDVTDATTLNVELGGEAAYERLCSTLREYEMGQLVDIVPNHMSTATPYNSWWWDVLEYGTESPYYHYFDFGSQETAPGSSVLRLPVLGGAYFDELNAGRILIERAPTTLRVRYYEAEYPLAARSYVSVLSAVAELTGDRNLGAVSDAFSSYQTGARAPLWRVLQGYLDIEENEKRFDEGLILLNSDGQRLHRILEQQHYRLSYWRSANDLLPYRRFFDISSLAGLHIERDDVFLSRHLLELGLVRDGSVDGLRVDHIDGLKLPGRYLRSLKANLPNVEVWVEKILAPDEALPDDWPVEGTTGYDYVNVANGLFIDPRGEEELTKLYARICDDERTYDEVLDEAKRQVVQELFAGDIEDIAGLLALVCESHAVSRDWPRRVLASVLGEYVVALPVYRTYVDGAGVIRDADRRIIHDALETAAAKLPDVIPGVFEFLANLLTARVDGPLEREFRLRLQQVTGPVMAKGAEDTAFYRYTRLLSVNEVGGEPSHFGTSVEAYHAWCKAMSATHPLTMLASSTHDTKRGEDARQRLNVLSEVASDWRQQVDHWMTHIESGALPPIDAPTAFLFLQTWVCAWPLSVERAAAYLQKANREAKRQTSWLNSDEVYEEGVKAFVEAALADDALSKSIAAFVASIDGFARSNSLAALLLKLTSPGVPDIYRGSEVGNHSLVDPDNRGPVDYGRLVALLDDAEGHDLTSIWQSGDLDAAKLRLTRSVLEIRRQDPEAFVAANSYEPVLVIGASAEQVLAYQRGGRYVVVARRWPTRDLDSGTTLALPEGGWRNVFTSGTHEGDAGIVDVFGGLPVALLVKEKIDA